MTLQSFAFKSEEKIKITSFSISFIIQPDIAYNFDPVTAENLLHFPRSDCKYSLDPVVWNFQHLFPETGINNYNKTLLNKYNFLLQLSGFGEEKKMLKGFIQIIVLQLVSIKFNYV